ncbi:DUF1819 family protein [Alteromonas pelagimontana]|uniref:DUF1819 family protein n=1 Tax=Alteromonas pelagimontana TaxID=1858656 RepID=A0A6M4M8V8_9ALTE|nr:BrxA family protein [Alteromonas pelagimontana]QJR79567.1 DUF1819 family protein [Alteromonas pelagimontana]
MPEQYYTTQLQAGLGLKEETKGLFELWAPGMNTQQLCDVALESGSFPNVTARRLRNIVAECFYPRYLRNEEVAHRVKSLLDVLSSTELSQIFYLYTSRSNYILSEFVKAVYWQKYASGYQSIDIEHAKEFIEQGLQEGKMKKPWSETTIKRVSSYILGCLADYGFLEGTTRKERKLTPPRVSDKIKVYLAYELHFSGLGDNAVINHPDWQLFGLTNDDVREELKALAVNRYWIIQAAGDVVQISWAYNNMEEVIDVIA